MVSGVSWWCLGCQGWPGGVWRGLVVSGVVWWWPGGV